MTAKKHRRHNEDTKAWQGATDEERGRASASSMLRGSGCLFSTLGRLLPLQPVDASESRLPSSIKLERWSCCRTDWSSRGPSSSNSRHWRRGRADAAALPDSPWSRSSVLSSGAPLGPDGDRGGLPSSRPGTQWAKATCRHPFSRARMRIRMFAARDLLLPADALSECGTRGRPPGCPRVVRTWRRRRRARCSLQRSCRQAAVPRRGWTSSTGPGGPPAPPSTRSANRSAGPRRR
mmetsp:Transcript_66333/g.176389  ORF Transcript_66333/g.176389 Transcript_66333/m.176389 type:complete len:235 (+) Transcript_66333:182-886(+)